MHRALRNTLVLTVALAASGCSDQEQPLPSAPDYHTIASSSSECDFTHLSQLANSYFAPPRQQVVHDLVADMDDAAEFSPAAKSLGFDIMAQIEAVVNDNTAGDPGVGANLVNHLILCMYNATTESASYPAGFATTGSVEDFTIALTPSLHGAFAVKPGFTGDAAVIFSRPVSEPFSGVAPSSGTWADVLVNRVGHPDRVLFYGRPGSTSTTYDWKTVPRDAEFNSLVVAVCVDADDETTSLLNEENVGLLPFVDALFLNPATCSPTSTALVDPSAPLMLAQGLIRLGTSLVAPRTLWATAFSPGGLGGSTGGARSEFGPSEIDHVTLEFQQQPTSTKVNTIIAPAVTVKATAFPTGGGTPKTLPNVAIKLAAVNNNGSTVLLSGTVLQGDGTVLQTTDGNGIATYSDLSLSKTGGYRLLATGVVGGRPAIQVLQATSVRFNVRP